MPQKIQPQIVLLMIGMAIVLAAGLFLAMSAIQNRPENVASEEVVVVEGQTVTLRRDTERRVRLLPQQVPAPEQAPPETAPEGENAQQQAPPAPTETPIPPVSGGEPEPTATPIPPTAVLDSVIFVDYTVQGTDTLYSIAQRTDTSIGLMAEHGISSEDLVGGTVIRLPVGNPDFCPGRRPYAVGEGDTAFSIGRRFGISAGDLQAINNLDAAFTIRVGEIICVP